MTVKKLLTAIIALALASSTLAGARSADSFGLTKTPPSTNASANSYGI